jgi:glycosyltransferase involved in cell wall biosynthesis
MRVIAQMTHLWDTVLDWLWPADISIFHWPHRPPYGGSNQFLLALRSELARRGWNVQPNVISGRTRACILNAFAFDVERLRRMRRPHCRIIHRVDGPVSTYRGTDDGTDRRIYTINSEFADVTIFQSQYSLEAHRAMGLKLKVPVVIMNAVDPRFFYTVNQRVSLRDRKVRLISTSWSDNPNKGATTYKWLDEHLDWDRFEYTFVGRTQVKFKRIRYVPAVPSKELGELLRQHDIYITASLHDPCSNALLEALACGLPALHANSGGHPEIVGDAGFGFSSAEEIPALLDHLLDEYEERRQRIAIPTLAEVADQYLSAMACS